MNKTIKTFGTILACLALTGTCLAAPHGGRHNPGPAPMHHRAPAPRHHHMPPPPPPPRHAVHHHHHHNCGHHTGVITMGAAVVGGLIGGLIGALIGR